MYFIEEIEAKYDRSPANVQIGGAADRSEEFRFFMRNTDGCENYRKISLAAAHLCLTGNLCRKIRMWKSGCREDWQFLPSYQCIQSIDSRYACLDELRRVVTGSRIHR